MLCRFFNDASSGEKAVAALIDLLASHGENGVGIGDSTRLGLMVSGDFREMMSQAHGNGRRSWRSRPD